MLLHFMMEFACGIIGVTVFLFSYPLYMRNKDFTSLYWFGTWGLWLGLLTITHSITSLLLPYEQNWLYYTYLPERVGFSILAMLCVYPGSSKEIVIYGIKKRVWIFIGFCVLFMINTAFGVLITDKLIITNGVIGRPQEIIPLCMACLVYGRLSNVTTKWGKIIKCVVFLSMISNAIMLFSHKLYDFQFIVSHGFKLIAYFFMFYALIYLLQNIRKQIDNRYNVFYLLTGK